MSFYKKCWANKNNPDRDKPRSPFESSGYFRYCHPGTRSLEVRIGRIGGLSWNYCSGAFVFKEL